MKVTFEEAVEEYLEYIKLKKKKNTYLTIERRIRRHIEPFFKDFKIVEIKPKDYLTWQIKIDKENFKYNYKSALHYTFVDFYNYCNLFYEIDNIAKKVGNFKNNDVVSEGNIWTIEEFSKFISVVDDKLYYVLFNMLYFTGLRKGELLALKWEDINFYENTLKINKTITRTHELQTPKTKSSNRIISLDDEMVRQLKELKTNYDGDFIFGNVTFTTLLRKKNYYCDLANVKRIKIHEFRHSHACLLFMNNVPIDQISNRLGHSKISITTDTYLKYIPKNEKRVIMTLNSLHNF